MAKIAKTVSKEYEELFNKVGRSDANYCGVAALHFATGLSFKECQDVLEHCGRRKGQGTSLFSLSAALGDLGYKVEQYRLESDPASYCFRSLNELTINKYPKPHNNLKSVTTHHPERFNKVWKELGTCFLFSKGHVSCVVDGEMKDWAKGSSRKVSEVWVIKKKEA